VNIALTNFFLFALLFNAQNSTAALSIKSRVQLAGHLDFHSVNLSTTGCGVLGSSLASPAEFSAAGFSAPFFSSAGLVLLVVSFSASFSSSLKKTIRTPMVKKN
jgi:hypothetical protein